MISEEKFVEALNLIKELGEIGEEFDKVSKKLDSDFPPISVLGFNTKPISMIIDLLQENFQRDKELFGSIPWWIYDTNYGKNNCNTIYWIPEGSDKELECTLDTPDKLYKYLVAYEKGEENNLFK